jgi:hypothetical protein
MDGELVTLMGWVHEIRDWRYIFRTPPGQEWHNPDHCPSKKISPELLGEIRMRKESVLAVRGKVQDHPKPLVGLKLFLRK